MITLTYQVQPEILVSLNKKPGELANELMLWAAISMYEHGKLSLARAATLAGMHRYDFETVLSKLNIPISDLSIDDIKNDLDALNNILK
ncbi:MAG TPA: hypothetical protein DCQ31_00990 [Bacteroidales bacterium]|nr:hypothetical protein [Bacteroidales bacterium]